MENKTIFKNQELTIDEKIDLIAKHIQDVRTIMKGTYHNSEVHVNYIIKLREQIRKLGEDPLPYPDDIIDEYIGY